MHLAHWGRRELRHLRSVERRILPLWHSSERKSLLDHLGRRWAPRP